MEVLTTALQRFARNTAAVQLAQCIGAVARETQTTAVVAVRESARI